MTWRPLTHQALGSALGSMGSLLRLPSRGSGGGSADSLEDSSSADEEEPPSAPTGFKLNLGKVAANQVDDAKPVAVPHTPKGEVVQGLEPWRRSQGSQDRSIDGGDGGGEESEVESSSEEEDLGPPPGPTGFKLNLGKVAVNQVDDAKPVAKPHTPREEVVQGLLAAQSGGSSGGQGSSSEVDSSSADEDEPAPVSTGFKLNLGKVAANDVDDAKPVAMPHTPKGEVVQGLLAAGGHDLGGGGSGAATNARGKHSRGSCSAVAVDAGALAQQGVHEGVVEQIEQGLARRGSSLFGIGGGTSGIDGGGGGGGGGGVLTRRTSVVPVDTTGDGRVDALAIDSNKDGRIDALIKLGDLGEDEAGAVGAALPGLDPSAEARASVLAKALAAMRPLDSFPVALPLDGLNAAQSMSSSIVSLASRCFNLGISHDRGISKVTAC